MTKLKRHLHIASSIEGSIGEITSDLIDGLQEHFILTREPDEAPEKREILLCHFLNSAVVNNRRFHKYDKKILIQPVDGTDILSNTIDIFNEFDLIITPGKAGREIMQNRGVTVPIDVIPNYYKPEYLNQPPPFEHPDIPKHSVMFYHESTFHARKGIEVLYEGFNLAFNGTEQAKDTVLVLKDSPYSELTFDRIEQAKCKIIEKQKECNGTPSRIVKISQKLRWHTLESLWSRADAYASFPGIEGFGIPMLRFAAFGKPVLTHNAKTSGYVDFLNFDNSYMTNGTYVPSTGEHMKMYGEDNQWYVPDVQDVADLFQQCYKDIRNNQAKKVPLAHLDHMKYENVMKKYCDLLKKV